MDFTEMYRINDISYTMPYKKNNAGSPYLVVGRKGGKYGIRNDKGEEFLPFEYDNITLYGFNLLQLVKNGKLGLLHIAEDETGTYKICRLLPCEYDVIDGRKEGYVFLRRYGHDVQGNYRVFVRAYFTKPRFISKEFTFDMELSNRFQRELISMSDGECEVIYDVNTGCPIYTDDSRNLILGAYHTKNGTVVQQAGALAQDRETEKGRLLSIDGAGVKSYDYVGATHKVGNALFGAGVFSINSVEVEGESNALGFIVGEDRGLRVLNEHLQPMSDKYFSHVSIITSIAGTDVSGDTTVLSLNPMQMGEDNIEFY